MAFLNTPGIGDNNLSGVTCGHCGSKFNGEKYVAGYLNHLPCKRAGRVQIQSEEVDEPIFRYTFNPISHYAQDPLIEEMVKTMPHMGSHFQRGLASRIERLEQYSPHINIDVAWVLNEIGYGISRNVVGLVRLLTPIGFSVRHLDIAGLRDEIWLARLRISNFMDSDIDLTGALEESFRRMTPRITFNPIASIEYRFAMLHEKRMEVMDSVIDTLGVWKQSLQSMIPDFRFLSLSSLLDREAEFFESAIQTASSLANNIHGLVPRFSFNPITHIAAIESGIIDSAKKVIGPLSWSMSNAIPSISASLSEKREEMAWRALDAFDLFENELHKLDGITITFMGRDVRTLSIGLPMPGFLLKNRNFEYAKGEIDRKYEGLQGANDNVYKERPRVQEMVERLHPMLRREQLRSRAA